MLIARVTVTRAQTLLRWATVWPTSVPSGILMTHPAVWPQQTWAENCVGPPPLFWGGAGSPSNTVWPGPRPIPSGILIHPTVWPQYTVTDRQKGQRSDSIGRTVLHTVAQKCWGQFLLRHSVATYAAKRRRHRARVMGVSSQVTHAAVRAEGVGAELVPFVTSHVCMSLLSPFLGHLHPCIAFMAALMYVCMYVREFITGAP